jgi:hypothetical protein
MYKLGTALNYFDHFNFTLYERIIKAKQFYEEKPPKHLSIQKTVLPFIAQPPEQ